MPEIIQSQSQVSHSYSTIRMTQSRIDKGLIAVPMFLAKQFPEKNAEIQIYLSNSPISQVKHYSSYNSSTRECRIGGMRDWFRQNNISNGDEIVVQIINGEKFIYRLIPERDFILKTKELQQSFDVSKDESGAARQISTLSQWVHAGHEETVFSEYRRLFEDRISRNRQYTRLESKQIRETVPVNIKTLLREIYKGHCQVCDFWFLKKNEYPYFEIHHLNPLVDHHPKNLVVVCGNCHNQFEYAKVSQNFSNEGWLVDVSFNSRKHIVRQAVFFLKEEPIIKNLYV